MRIAFDGTTLRPRRTGVGYYTEHLLHHLAEQTSDGELTVVSNQPVETDLPLPPQVRIAAAPRHVPRTVWLQTNAPAVLKAIGADVAHFTNGMVPVFSPTPTVVTIHDVSLRRYPRYHPLRRVVVNGPLVELAARRADAIITVSESAKADIVRAYRVDPARVHVVYEAAAPSFGRVRDPETLARVRRRYGLGDRIVLYVGTIEPRKNLPKLIDAFAGRLRAGDLAHQLVCVGPYGWMSHGIGERGGDNGLKRSINFTGYVPFEDLPALYSLAEMFVYPSMYEGFGLPIIEAMACGVPVITSRASALAEVGGNAVRMVEPLEADSLGDAIVELAGDRAARERMAAAGIARASEFSWERAARESLEVYRSVVRIAGLKPCATTNRSPLDVAQAFRPAKTEVAQGVTTAAATDVLFGQAYFLRFDPKVWDAQQPYAPLGTLYAASAVRARGYSVALFDAMLAESLDDWAVALDRHRPRYAVIYEDNFNYLSKMCLLRMRDAALAMIDRATARGIPTIVAGADATDHADVYLDRGASVVIFGEGEMTLVDVLDALSGARAGGLEGVDGIWLRNDRGRLVRTPARDIIRDPDTLPLPAWDLVDVGRYERIWRSRHGYFSMNVVTTRGCPYHCNWCAKPIYGQRYTARSPEHVVDEIAWLRRAYRPDHLWIADDIFGLKPGWIVRFAELVQARDAAVPFKCLLRADQVTPAVAAALRAARCRTVWIGAESGSQRILDAMEKGTRVDQIAAATRLLRREGIEVGFFLQFGYPGETRGDIEQTLQMVRACRPDDIGVSVSYPLPGTPFYERVKSQLGEKQNWLDSDDLAMMYRATYSPEFYRALYALVHSEFRVRKSAHAAALLLAQPWTIRRRHGYDLAGLAWHAVRLPVLRRRLAALSEPAGASLPLPLLIPLSSPQAAAVPTDQSTLK
jgi:anaerobic magnesium-protoporphyrin IX monomethyl ester cyclase